MSYLDIPRINITGEFYTDPSTIDNDPAHYEPDCLIPAPWQEPNGKHDFKLTQGTVASALGPGGSHVQDAVVIGANVTTTDRPAPAKIADLDVYQQNVPTIFGLNLKIDFNDETSLIGKMDPATANGLSFQTVLPKRGWNQGYGMGSYGGDSYARGTFQTVLRVDPQDWPQSKSPLLQQLKKVCMTDESGRIVISFRFVVDNYINNPEDPNCHTGRFIGVLGPQFEGEPTHCPGNRWLKARPLPDDAAWFVPAFYDAPFKVDAKRKRLVIDLSNSICKTEVNGPFVDLGVISAVVPGEDEPQTIGSVNFNELVYQSGGGICDVPLSPEQLKLLQERPLTLVTSRDDIGHPQVLSEAENGVAFAIDHSLVEVPISPGVPQRTQITTDGRVLRMPGTPKTQMSCRLYATQWGKPLQGKEFAAEIFPVYGYTKGVTVPPIQPGKDIPYPGDTSTAKGAIKCSLTATDDAGYATAKVTVKKDPGYRTTQLDGQVYFIVVYDPDNEPTPNLNDKEKPNFAAAAQERQISCLVWSDYQVKEEPTWEDVREMMVPYVKLFPYMKEKIDLTDETAFKLYSNSPPYNVPSKADPHRSAFYGVPTTFVIHDRINRGAIPFMLAADPNTDPRFMPVTRDLSPAKINTILNFIQNNYFPEDANPGAHAYHATGEKP